MRPGRVRFHRTQCETSSTPSWAVTYADFVTVLLCLFVAILSMSTIQKDRFQTALGSLQETFGGDATVPSTNSLDLSLYGRLRPIFEESTKMAPSVSAGESERSAVAFSRIPNGAKLVLAGPMVFERGQAGLAEGSRRTLAELAEELKGRRYRLTIRGHSAGEAPQDGEDARDLSYARAISVAQLLERAGVSAELVSVVAVGDSQPLLEHAYTEKRRAQNRRVEIEIIEGDAAEETIRLTSADEVVNHGS